MAYVMVPVPEDKVQEVMQFVVRLTTKEQTEPWDDAALAGFFAEADEPSKALLAAVAASALARKPILEQEAADAIQLSRREMVGIMRELNELAAEASRPALVWRRSEARVLPGGQTTDVRVLSMPDDVAEMIQALDRCSPPGRRRPLRRNGHMTSAAAPGMVSTHHADRLPPAIDVDAVSISYRIRVDEASLLGDLRNVVRGRGRGKRDRMVPALRDVSFSVAPGSVLAIVGRNGAGKSTLLRAISGVLAPEAGRITVRGRMNLLAPGVGFNQALTGRQNVTLGGLAAGLSRARLAEITESITDFAELGEYIDYPIRTYSSGMRARLGFAVAAHLDPEVLLIDEALSAGDAGFADKVHGKMIELCGRGRTIVLVTHGLSSVRSMATEAIWLHQGQVAAAWVARGDRREVPPLLPPRTSRHDVRRVMSARDAVSGVEDTHEPRPAPDALGAASTLSAKDSSPRPHAEQGSQTTRPDPLELGENVQVFESGSVGRQRLGPYLRLFWARRSFMAELARSNVRGRHANTALGSLWGVLDPLFMAALYFFLFTVIRGGNGRPGDFLPVLVGGIFLFALTTAALNDGGKSVTRSGALMLNSVFPRVVLPVSALYASLIAFAPTVLVYVVIYAAFGAAPDVDLLVLPVLFAIQMILNLGLALLVSTVIVFFRDVENSLRYVQRLLFFTTPVIWPATLVPERILSVLEWSPLFPLFASYQAILSGGSAPVEYVLRSAVWAFAVLLIGSWAFLRYERLMASRL